MMTPTPKTAPMNAPIRICSIMKFSELVCGTYGDDRDD